jgi:hypothetical protein
MTESPEYAEAMRARNRANGAPPGVGIASQPPLVTEGGLDGRWQIRAGVALRGSHPAPGT